MPTSSEFFEASSDLLDHADYPAMEKYWSKKEVSEVIMMGANKVPITGYQLISAITLGLYSDLLHLVDENGIWPNATLNDLDELVCRKECFDEINRRPISEVLLHFEWVKVIPEGLLFTNIFELVRHCED